MHHATGILIINTPSQLGCTYTDSVASILCGLRLFYAHSDDGHVQALCVMHLP